MSVSVVIPTRNRAKQLRSCLKSLAFQVVQPKEVIVVDNGSVDETKRVVSSFQQKLPLRYVFEPKAGISIARNNGIKRAKGDIVGFFDDDCFIDRNWVKEILASFENGTDVIQGRPFEKYNSPLSALSYYRVEKILRADLVKAKKIKGFVLLSNFFDTKNLAIHKRVLKKLDYFFDEKLKIYGEDVDLGIRLRRLGVSVFFNPKAKIYHYSEQSFLYFIKKNFHRGEGFYLLKKKWERKAKRLNMLRRHFKESFSEEIDLMNKQNKSIVKKIDRQLKKDIFQGKSLGFKMIFYLLLFLSNLVWHIGFNYQKGKRCLRQLVII